MRRLLLTLLLALVLALPCAVQADEGETVYLESNQSTRYIITARDAHGKKYKRRGSLPGEYAPSGHRTTVMLPSGKLESIMVPCVFVFSVNMIGHQRQGSEGPNPGYKIHCAMNTEDQEYIRYTGSN